ncbi:GGDEF domain-containing protein [Paenibacillus sp. GCM10027629]|uniref:GGDEF domain-containing protein n=1 Tax=Paenibacillus sp. GCM10027629 TaxID=3273414 RepID=UPI00363E8438
MKNTIKTENAPAAIFIIDLDNLKIVIDTLGHRQGDQLIKEAAGLLDANSRENLYVSRVGGDEFAILMINTSIVKVEELFQSIQRDIARYNGESQGIEIHMSIGYAYGEQSFGNMESLYVEADRKMYEDKVSRKSMAS